MLGTRPAPEPYRTARRLTAETESKGAAAGGTVPESMRHALLAAALERLGSEPEPAARIWIPVDFAMTAGDRRRAEESRW